MPEAAEPLTLGSASTTPFLVRKRTRGEGGTKAAGGR